MKKTRDGDRMDVNKRKKRENMKKKMTGKKMVKIAGTVTNWR